MTKRSSNLVEWAMRHKNLNMLVVSLFMIFGIFALVNMPKNEFPSFTVRQGVVVAVYPGASPEQIEEEVTKPLEDFIFQFKEVKKKKVEAKTRDGIVYIMVELNDNIKNKDKFWSKFKLQLNNFKSSLPTGVLALIANDDFGDTSALLITLESKDKTYRELHEYMKRLKSEFRKVEAISAIREFGMQNEEISVNVDNRKFSQYVATGNFKIAGSVFSRGFTTIGGSIQNKEFISPIHVKEDVSGEEAIANQILYYDPTGNIVRIKDIAKVKREYPRPESFIKSNGVKCLILSLEMQEGKNIVKMGKKVNNILDGFQKTLPDDVKIFKITDQSKVVNDSINTFLKELLIAVIAVIIIIFLLMPLKVSIIASLTIPVTIFFSLTIFYAFGIELDTVTLAALIASLGMIVDNSIVIIDSYMEKIGEGMPRWTASIESAKEFFKSIFSATLAISVTFFPFLFTTKGMLNDFLQAFPWAMAIVLFLSLLVAEFIVPYLQYSLITEGVKVTATAYKKNNKKGSFLEKFQAYYEKLLRWSFRKPDTVIMITLVCFAIGVIILITRPVELFPIAERNQFAVEIYLPKGTAVEKTSAVADSISKILGKDKRVVSVTSFVGESSPRFQTTYAPQLPGSNYAQLIVNTESNNATEEILDDYTDKYTNYFPEASLRFKQLQYSEYSNPVEIRITGKDRKMLNTAADTIIERLRKNNDLIFTRCPSEEYAPCVTVNYDVEEASKLGISKTAFLLNSAMDYSSGIPLTTLWEGDYPVKVVVKSNGAEKGDYIDYENSYVNAWYGITSVPLRQIATVTPEWIPGELQRRNGNNTVTITSDVRRGVNADKANKKIFKDIEENVNIPEGVTIVKGGEPEFNDEMFPQLFLGLFIAVFIIFFILLFHFESVTLALLLLLSLILCVFGGAMGFLLMGKNFSVTGILGFVSLMGILVRNGIIMIDYAEELRNKKGLKVREAAFESAKRRMRPIFLTSAAASFGVIPMILGRSALWSPMGAVVCFGTMISMVFIVTVLPIAYWKLFRNSDESRKRANELENV